MPYYFADACECDAGLVHPCDPTEIPPHTRSVLLDKLRQPWRYVLLCPFRPDAADEAGNDRVPDSWQRVTWAEVLAEYPDPYGWDRLQTEALTAAAQKRAAAKAEALTQE